MLRALLTNIQVLAKISSSKKTVPDQPYFNKKWGKDTAFEKSVDRSSYVNDKQGQTSQINDQILVMFKTNNSVDTGRNVFLNKLADESIDFINAQRERLAKAKQEEELCHNSMAVMTEHIFEILKSYSYELNNVLGYGPFHVAATNPQSVTEVVKYNRLRQPEESISYYRARLSTTTLSLVLRGDKHGVQFFIIPVARALGLSSQESHFVPILRLATRLKEGNVYWETESGLALTPRMVEVICMNLFQQLIDESKQQITRLDEESIEQAAASAC